MPWADGQRRVNQACSERGFQLLVVDTPLTQWKMWFHFLIEHDLPRLDPGALTLRYLSESYVSQVDAELVHLG